MRVRRCLPSCTMRIRQKKVGGSWGCWCCSADQLSHVIGWVCCVVTPITGAPLHGSLLMYLMGNSPDSPCVMRLLENHRMASPLAKNAQVQNNCSCWCAPPPRPLHFVPLLTWLCGVALPQTLYGTAYRSCTCEPCQKREALLPLDVKRLPGVLPVRFNAVTGPKQRPTNPVEFVCACASLFVSLECGTS